MLTQPILSSLRSLIAPPRCAACELPLDSGELAFCGACKPLLERPARALRPPAAGAAVFLYGGPLADAVQRFKYRPEPALAAVLGRLMSESCMAYAGRVDRVVPLPLHPRRLRQRGFNQSALLAAPLARALGVPLDLRRLRRVRETPSQASLPRARRADNVRGAFRAAPCDGLRILLVDDVRTTGATLAAAARCLLEAGAASAATCALARAEG